MVIGPNTLALVDYVLRDEDGEVVEESAAPGEPLRYVHGYGMIVAGLEAALLGMAPGDHKRVKLTSDDGYGDYDDELVFEVDRAELGPEAVGLEEGDALVLRSPNGEEAMVTVVEMTPDYVLVDGNHPLAGQALDYELTVREVRDATAAEIATAVAEFELAREDAVTADDGRTRIEGKGKPN